ncbi:hypothetical protein J6590_000854 [Homalodisca vitripennis]|nr:hypothetical protein J6590_000854 [Homalodisca vitripennis]
MSDVWDGNGIMVSQISLRPGVFVTTGISIKTSITETVRIFCQSSKIRTIGNCYFMSVGQEAIVYDMCSGGETMVSQVSMSAGEFVTTGISIASITVTVTLCSQSSKIRTIGNCYFMDVGQRSCRLCVVAERSW